MNGKNFGEPYAMENTGELNNQVVNNPSAYADPYARNVPIDVIPVQEIPVAEIEAPAPPVNPPYVIDPPVVESPVQESRVVGTPTFVSANDDTTIPAAPMGETSFHEEPHSPALAPPEPLLTHDESEHFRTHWNEIQARFVDEPRVAVQQADALVSEVIGQITQMFANEHNALEGQWNQGNDVSTEDLRMSLQRYRSFFKRLVV